MRPRIAPLGTVPLLSTSLRNLLRVWRRCAITHPSRPSGFLLPVSHGLTQFPALSVCNKTFSRNSSVPPELFSPAALLSLDIPPHLPAQVMPLPPLLFKLNIPCAVPQPVRA